MCCEFPFSSSRISISNKTNEEMEECFQFHLLAFSWPDLRDRKRNTCNSDFIPCALCRYNEIPTWEEERSEEKGDSDVRWSWTWRVQEDMGMVLHHYSQCYNSAATIFLHIMLGKSRHTLQKMRQWFLTNWEITSRLKKRHKLWRTWDTDHS